MVMKQGKGHMSARYLELLIPDVDTWLMLFYFNPKQSVFFDKKTYKHGKHVAPTIT